MNEESPCCRCRCCPGRARRAGVTLALDQVCGSSSACPRRRVALTNVRVVDGTGAPPLEEQTIVIENGKIASVAPAAQARVPAGARTIDLTGHTVIPGLVGMHDHTFYTTRGRSVQLQFSAPRLYLGARLTTIRTTGGTSPYHEINMKRGIDRGRDPGSAHAPHRAVSDRPRRRGDDGADRIARGSAAHRQLLGRRGRDVVQGLHRHQPRGARRRDRRGAQARAQVHRASLLGVVPRGGRARHRQPRARPLHQQRLRARTGTPDHCPPDMRTAC